MLTLETTTEQRQVLVVEDDVKVRGIITEVVVRLGYTPLEARSVPRALSILRRETIDLMLLDLYLQGSIGMDLLHALNGQETRVPTVVVSGNISDSVARQLVGLGVNNMVTKPFTLNRLATEIQRIIGPEESVGAENTPPISADQRQKQRRDERIPMKLPIRTPMGRGKRDYMKLVDISSTGMQTVCKNLDVVKLGDETQHYAFDIPLIAQLAWIKAKLNDTFTIGWKFDKRIRPHTSKKGDEEILDNRDPEHRQSSRLHMQQPIKARIGGGKHLDMQLIDISSTGMQTLCNNLEVFNLNSPAKGITFEFPVTVRLAWVKANPNGTFRVGWKFTEVRRS
ncbi:MAG: response regulator [bacterium]|nr:response regulator [bacterium]